MIASSFTELGYAALVAGVVGLFLAWALYAIGH